MTDESRRIRAGFVGFGEVNTPRELVEKKCAEAAIALEKQGMELLRAGVVRDVPGGADSDRAAAELAGKDFDLLILCVAGWIPSWAVLRTADPFRHKPMMLLGLTGWRDGDRFITTADQAGTTSLRKPMEDMGYKFKYVATFRGGALPVGEIMPFAKAARAASMLRNARIGMAGYRDMRLYGTMYDGVSLKAKTGVEMEHFDLLEIFQDMQKLDPAEVAAKSAAVRKNWDFLKEPKPGTVENSVRFETAALKKIEERGWSGFSFCDVDGVKKLFGFAPAGAMTLLHDETDVRSIPENDALGAVTQLMVGFLGGEAAYLEFYEFMENGAMMGVPDYVPSSIVDGRVAVMPNSFGDFGEGLLNVSKLRTGGVTICRLGSSGADYSMHVMTGEAKSPIKWEEAGWTPPAPQLPSLDIIFDGPVRDFIQKVMGQHYIIAYGNLRAELESLCSLLKIRLV